MAIPGATQALIAAFAFGIVVNSASAALFLNVKGHGSAIFRDGPRLVLITFLLSAALWAQTDFISIFIDTTAVSACQVGVVFSTLFDQLARFSIEQFLAWTVNSETEPQAVKLGTQLALGVRFVIGAIFVGFSRPQTVPVCLPTSSILPLAVVVVALDAFVITSLAARAYFSRNSDTVPGRPLLLVFAGLAAWTATSVTMLLGIKSMELTFRTTVPAAGLICLLFIVTGCAGTLTVDRSRLSRQPESPIRRIVINGRSVTTSDSDEYPPDRYEDLKRGDVLSVTAFYQHPNAGNAKTLPKISRPITGVKGVGGVPVKGQLFPPIRGPMDLSAAEPRSQPKQKRAVFGFKSSGADNGILAISNPILEANGSQNPLNKIPTIDLATAARLEQERRNEDLQRSSALIAKRPAPQPPSVSSEEAVKRAASFKRKEVASIGSHPSLPSSLEPMPSVAATSSAQLSPGVEEIRRRSPRQPPTDLRSKQARPASPQRQPTYVSPPSESSWQDDKDEVFEAETARRADVRPSRSSPVSSQATSADSVKTPLQRRPTNGLPQNPRAMAVKALAKESSGQRQQTVMFVNNIVYNDPSMVQNIMEDATTHAKEHVTEATTAPALTRSDSMVHRPRPIPRKPEKDRAIFPAEPSLNQSHRRSRSAGSIISRKSILRSTPGSPTSLPPLPPPPKSAGNSERPLPNDTKSMTFDEKMNLFYTISPKETPKPAVRKSSVPEVPKIPMNFMDMSPSTEEFETERRDSKTTHRTTKTTIKTNSLFEDANVSLVEPSMERDVNRYQSGESVDDIGNAWLYTPEPERPSQLYTDDKAKRASSPIIPPFRASAMTESTDRTTDDAASTNWGTVYSPAAAVNIPVVRQNARSTYIKSGERLQFDQDNEIQLPQTVYQAPVIQIEHQQGPAQWHRRIGDEIATFSERKDQSRLRKMSPPSPLLLGVPSTRNPVIVKAAELSPLESPEHAIQFIKAQLKKFEQPEISSASSGQRFALLENLENEMDMQQGQWQQMQHNLRDSTSTFRTSPTIESRRESLLSNATRDAVREPGVRLTLAERRAVRRSRMRSGGSFKTDDSSDFLEAMDSGRASVWQQRIAEAQEEYAENANELQVHRTRTMLSMAQLGSPTPPDSDESDVEEMLRPKSINTIVEGVQSKLAPKTLWMPTDRSASRRRSSLWEPSNAEIASPMIEEVAMTVTLRRTYRKPLDPLTIQSSRLWRFSAKTVESQSPSGLWKPRYDRSSLLPAPSSTSETEEQEQKIPQKPQRPVTQRPPRRQRRVTLLPDIVENPEPLPDKRGTLGIFQFPWGEKSDTATVHQPRNTGMFMAMPGTMSSGGSAALAARSKQVEETGYSSSFFEDYEDDVSGLEDYEDEDAEFEDFDETTLWEIASLLKTDNVPSRDSLLPSSEFSSILDEYTTDESEEDSDTSDYDYDDHRESIIVGIDDGLVTALRQKPSLLWTWSDSRVKRRSAHGLGLPTPDAATWNKYNNVRETVRAKPRRAVPATIESTALWGAKQTVQHSKLWTARKDLKAKGQHGGKGLAQPDERTWRKYNVVQETVRAKPRRAEPAIIESTALWGAAQQTVQHSKLWTARKDVKTEGKGLAQPDEKTWQKYDLFQETARAKPRKTEPAIIKSADLWAVPTAKKIQRYSGTWADQGRIQKQRRSRGLELASLWTIATVATAVEHSGLFRIEELAKPNTRTTQAEPAAAVMVRKPRAAEHKPLDKISSTSLWTLQASKAATTERNWIMEKEPVPPPVVLDDTIPATNVGVKQPTWWEKMKARAGVGAVIESQPTMRRKIVSVQEWDAELEEALAGSYPRVVRPRVTTAAEWEDALGEAIALGGTVAAPQLSEAAQQQEQEQEKKIMAQIQALEEERLYVERVMRGETVEMPPVAVPATAEELLWAKSEGVESASATAVASMLWAPGAKTAASTQQQQVEVMPASSSRGRTSSKSRRRAELRAQIEALENGADPVELGLSVEGQGMWTPPGEKEEEGSEARNWLGGGVAV